MHYLLYGQDALLLDERIATLRHQLDVSNLSTTVIDVQLSTIEDIAGACHSSPFFGGQRVVVLRDPIPAPKRNEAAPDASVEASQGRVPWNVLEGVFRLTPPTTSLIVRHVGSLRASHYAVKTAKSLGWTIESFATPRGTELLAWVDGRAQALGVSIQPDAAKELLRRLHPTSWQKQTNWDTDEPNMRTIATEVEKLASGASDDVITRQLVESLVVDRAGYTAFALNDRAFSGDVDAALRDVDAVLESGEPAERVLSQLASEVAVLSGAATTRAFGVAEVAAAMGATESRVNIARQKASGMSAGALGSASELIRGVEAGTKTGQGSGTSASIAPLVAEIANVMRVASNTGRAGRRR